MVRRRRRDDDDPMGCISWYHRFLRDEDEDDDDEEELRLCRLTRPNNREGFGLGMATAMYICVVVVVAAAAVLAVAAEEPNVVVVGEAAKAFPVVANPFTTGNDNNIKYSAATSKTSMTEEEGGVFKSMILVYFLSERLAVSLYFCSCLSFSAHKQLTLDGGSFRKLFEGFDLRYKIYIQHRDMPKR